MSVFTILLVILAIALALSIGSRVYDDITRARAVVRETQREYGPYL